MVAMVSVTVKQSTIQTFYFLFLPKRKKRDLAPSSSKGCLQRQTDPTRTRNSTATELDIQVKPHQEVGFMSSGSGFTKCYKGSGQPAFFDLMCISTA